MSLFTGKTLIAAGIGGLLAMSLSAHAGVVLSSSRVIYGQTLHEKPSRRLTVAAVRSLFRRGLTTDEKTRHRINSICRLW